MPDFERLTRKLHEDICDDPAGKALVVAYHRGLDRARKEVAVVAAIVAAMWIIISVLVG